MRIIAEYRTIDKSDWMRGPWDSEPDKLQMVHEETGLPCLIVRGPVGALCGYVGVPEGHPWHGVDYDNCGFGPKPEGYEEDWYVDVHGGLTFSNACSHGDDPAKGVCHVPEAGEPDNVWWLGFDCAHYGDLTCMSYPAHIRDGFGRSGEYRDVEYVKAQIANLARQAAKAIAARSDETAQQAQPEGQERGPKASPK